MAPGECSSSVRLIIPTVPKDRSFPGDDCVLDFSSLAGKASSRFVGDFGGSMSIEKSIEPPVFLMKRSTFLDKTMKSEDYFSVLARRYVVHSLRKTKKESDRKYIKPLSWVNICDNVSMKGLASAESLSILNLSSALPGNIQVRFLNEHCLVALPHCVTYDVRTVRGGSTKTPETALGSAKIKVTPRFSTDVPEIYYVKVHLNRKNSRVCIDQLTYHNITSFVKRPHAFACVENRPFHDQLKVPSVQYLIIGGELMPAKNRMKLTVLGIHYINLVSEEIEHSVALSTDVMGDIISSIDLCLLPQTIFVVLRYGGIYIVQSGRIVHHVIAPYVTNGCLATCKSLDPQIIVAQGLTGRLFVKSIFTLHGDWEYLKSGATSHAGRCALNLPSPQLLIGVPLSAMNERKLLTSFCSGIVNSDQRSPMDNTLAPLFRIVTAYGHYFYSKQKNSLYLTNTNHLSMLYGTIGGELIGVMHSRMKTPSSVKFQILQLHRSNETSETDRHVRYSLRNSIDEKFHVHDVPIDKVADVNSLASITIESVCCVPIRDCEENLVCTTTAGGLLLLFNLGIHVDI